MALVNTKIILPDVQQVALRAHVPFSFGPQDGPGFLHRIGLNASNAHLEAAIPPMLQPVNGEQQMFAPKHRPDRPGPHRVHLIESNQQLILFVLIFFYKTHLFMDKSIRWQMGHQ